MDEDRLEQTRRAALGDLMSSARLLSNRLRSGEVPERNVRAAALMGVPEARVVLGLVDVSPERARDELVLLLDTSDRVYAVLWAWASARVVLDHVLYTILSSPCRVALGRVVEWLADPMSERASRCRDAAYAILDLMSVQPQRFRDNVGCAIVASAYASLSVSPWEADFMQLDTDERGFSSLRTPGFDAPAGTPRLMVASRDFVRTVLLASPELAFHRGAHVAADTTDERRITGFVSSAAPYVRNDREGVRVTVEWEHGEEAPSEWMIDELYPIGGLAGGAEIPELVRAVPAFSGAPNSLLNAMAFRSSAIAEIVVRLDVAVAATAHLAAAYALAPTPTPDAAIVRNAMTTLSDRLAEFVRPRLLGAVNPSGHFSGREVLS